MSRHLPYELRGEFDELLEEIGIWAVYTRADRRFPCPVCLSLTTGDAKEDCGTCFGTGYRVTLERWRVYPTSTLTRARYLDTPLAGTGFSPEHSPVVFTRSTEIPLVADCFLIPEWDRDVDGHPDHAQPLRLVDAYRVTFVDRAYAGAVIYHACHCHLVSEARPAYERALLRTPVTITRR